MDDTTFNAPEENKTVFKVFGLPVFSKTEIKTVKYDTTELYENLSEKISTELIDSLKKVGVVK